MKNIINILEEENQLKVEDECAVIVCGNSNYEIKFSFSEQWNNCFKKIAFFVVDDKKITIDFEGDVCKVPVLPNGNFVSISIISNDGINQLATTLVKIRLEPTMAASDLSEYNQVASYLSKLIGEINKISNGDIVAKVAETSLSQVDLTNNQQIEGVKNFVGGIQKNGVDILNKNEISNPNILINGDFKINQRGKTSYTGAGYSVDRWRNSNNSTIVKKLEGIGIELSSNSGSVYLIQTIEDGFNTLKGKTVNASVKINGVVYSATGIVPTEIPTTTTQIAVIPNQQGIISTGLYVRNSGVLMFQIGSNGTTLNIEYAKLELGAVSTTFIPKTYAEELAMCQRYFYSTGATSSKAMLLTARTTYDFYQNYFYFPVQMRTQPTISLYGGENEYANALPLKEDNNTCIEVASDAGLGVGNGFMIYAKNNNAVEGSQYKLNKIEADAEIY